MVFLMSGREHVAVGDCLANPNQVVNFINSRYLNWLMRDGGLLLHAAGVARGDAGVALTGFPGAGKSTLALHLMREGYNFVSNDRLVIRVDASRLRMDGLPKHPRVTGRS
jgi:HprK-related kinase B